MVALYDYDPFHSGVSGRPPQDQLSLKKGDIMTAFGDVDVNGFYRVDLNGENLSSVSLIKIGFLFIKLIETEVSRTWELRKWSLEICIIELFERD